MTTLPVSHFRATQSGHPGVTVRLFRCRVRPPIDWGHADFEAPELRSNGRAGTVTAPGGGRGSLTYRYDHVFAQGWSCNGAYIAGLATHAVMTDLVCHKDINASCGITSDRDEQPPPCDSSWGGHFKTTAPVRGLVARC